MNKKMSPGFCSNLHLERAFGYRFTKCLPCSVLRFSFHGHIQHGFSFSRSFSVSNYVDNLFSHIIIHVAEG
jgi:hypothetical protein